MPLSWNPGPSPDIAVQTFRVNMVQILKKKQNSKQRVKFDKYAKKKVKYYKYANSYLHINIFIECLVNSVWLYLKYRDFVKLNQLLSGKSNKKLEKLTQQELLNYLNL